MAASLGEAGVEGQQGHLGPAASYWAGQGSQACRRKQFVLVGP
jgi:hypothetical protein